jgi:hypothetical protein
MEEFKKYYKFPLKMWNNFSIKVFTQDDKMAFDWLLPDFETYCEIKAKLLAKINGEEVESYAVTTKFYIEDGIIYSIIVDECNEDKKQKVARVRGWGMLTGVGGYNLPADKAAEIQDAFAEYCVEMLNKK